MDHHGGFAVGCRFASSPLAAGAKVMEKVKLTKMVTYFFSVLHLLPPRSAYRGVVDPPFRCSHRAYNSPCDVSCNLIYDGEN